MKVSKLATIMALAGMLPCGLAMAQSPVRQPSSVQQTAFAYGSYYDEGEAEGGAASASPSDAPAAAEPAPAPAASDTACTTCNTGCSTCDSGCDSCDSDPWSLFGDCEHLKCHNITVAGWLAQSFTVNPAGPSDRWNGPVTWNDRSNDYQLNQLYLYGERATDTGGDGWDLGGRVDALYGTDHRFTTATGLENFGDGTPKWNSGRFYGLVLPQFYMEAAYNDLKVKMGHWYSPVGYEVVPTTGNFFTTLPYTFQYGEPFTHTGVLATYTLTDKWTVGGGFQHGWDNFDNTGNPNLGFIGTVSRSFDSGGSVAMVFVQSNELVGSGAFRQRYLQTFVFQQPLNDDWSYVGQSDLGIQNDALDPTVNNGMGRWYGLNQYLFYKASDTLTWGLRAEWFRDEGGTRVGGFLQPTPTGQERGLPGPAFGNLQRTGYDGSFYQITFGPNWKPNGNLVVRPNVRWDWFSGKANNPAGLRPYNDGVSNSQFLFAVDAIVTF